MLPTRSLVLSLLALATTLGSLTYIYASTREVRVTLHSEDGNEAAAPATVKVGQPAPDFKLKGVDGRIVSLSETVRKGRGAIVIFTCNHCPYSQRYEDRIKALHETYAPKGMPVLAVNPNDATKQPEDGYPQMQQRALDKQFPFSYLHDETQATARAYGAARTPHVFVITGGQGGRSMEVAYIGAIDNNANDVSQIDRYFLKDALDALLAGKRPDPSSTLAVGCAIKWR